nr:hypothetical protein BaRGS_014740 [Batillaria attramentaria]
MTTVYTLQNIDFKLLYQVADLLGVDSENITKFTGQLEKGQLDKFPSCMVFDKGGHYLQQTQAGIITPVLFNLLKSVRPGFSL